MWFFFNSKHRGGLHCVFFCFCFWECLENIFISINLFLLAFFMSLKLKWTKMLFYILSFLYQIQITQNQKSPIWLVTGAVAGLFHGSKTNISLLDIFYWISDNIDRWSINLCIPSSNSPHQAFWYKEQCIISVAYELQTHCNSDNNPSVLLTKIWRIPKTNADEQRYFVQFYYADNKICVFAEKLHSGHSTVSVKTTTVILKQARYGL